MPAGRVLLHERHALALVRRRDHDLRPPADALRLLQRREHLAHVVAVGDLDHVPAEGAPLLGQRVHAHDVRCRPIVLEAVAIDDGRHLVEFEVGGSHHRLPVLALVEFTVAQQAVAAPGGAVDAGRQRQPQAERQPHAQRAAAHLDARRGAAHDVALQLGAEAAEAGQQRGVEVAGLGQRGVEHGRRVALAQHEAVAVGPIGPGGVVAQHAAEVERRQDLDRRQRPAGVPRLGRVRHLDDVAAEALRRVLQRLHRSERGHPGPSGCRARRWR